MKILFADGVGWIFDTAWLDEDSTRPDDVYNGPIRQLLVEVISMSHGRIGIADNHEDHFTDFKLQSVTDLERLLMWMKDRDWKPNDQEAD